MAEDAVVRLEFTLTAADMRAAAKLISRSRFSRSMLAWILILSIAVLIFVIFHDPAPPAAPVAAPAAPIPKNSLFELLFNVVPYIAIVLLVFFVWRRFRFRAFRDPEMYVVTLSPAGATWDTHDSHFECRWTHYKRFAENRAVFVLYVGERRGTPLPKRIMTPAQVEHVRALLQANVVVTRGFPVLVNK